MNDLKILQHGQDCIPYEECMELVEATKRYYHFSSPNFWMWKMFQFGYAYGKRAERRKKKNASNSAATLKEAM